MTPSSTPRTATPSTQNPLFFWH
jgi:hypothetical protein